MSYPFSEQDSQLGEQTEVSQLSPAVLIAPRGQTHLPFLFVSVLVSKVEERNVGHEVHCPAPVPQQDSQLESHPVLRVQVVVPSVFIVDSS